MNSSEQRQWKDDDGGHTAQFEPDPWRPSWDYKHILPAPAQSTKRAAEKLLRAEQFQQGLEWVLLAHLAVTLGFLRVMPRQIYWLTWANFVLVGAVKLGRQWGLACCFRDVPCAYVPLHQGPARDFIRHFGRGLLAVTAIEVGLTAGYFAVMVHEWTNWEDGDGRTPFRDSRAPYPAKTMLEVITGATCLLLVHIVCNYVVLRRYNSAMKLGMLGGPSKQQQQPKQMRLSDFELERSLCLTWWVHIARHRHLSAADARTQPGACGLPGQWYETVAQLKKIVEQSTIVGVSSNLDIVWLSQEVAVRALLSIAIQGQPAKCQTILQDNGFRLLLLVLSEGKPESIRGLAAAAIGELADQDLQTERVRLALAVVPLKRLARSHAVELKEMAMGSMLNLVLNPEQRDQVVAEILSGVEEYFSREGPGVGPNRVPGDSAMGQSETFVDMLLDCIRLGPTTLCQVLGAGLLVKLVGNQKVRDVILREHPFGVLHGSNLELFVKLLREGLTDEVQASMAGLLWALACWDSRAIGDDLAGDNCIQALVTALWGERQVAAAAAGALATLASTGDRDRKLRIVETEGSVEGMVRLLRDELSFRNRHTEQEMTNAAKVQIQGQTQAARALRFLAANDEENQNLIVHAGALPEIANLLQNKSSHLLLQAAATLDAMAHRNRKVQDFVGASYPEIFTRVTQLLDPGRYDVLDELGEKTNSHPHILETVLEKGALAVRSLAEGHRPNRERFLDAGAKERLQSILIRHREGGDRGKRLCTLVEKSLNTLQ